MPPFISIITVSLNAERTIRDTLASVAMQTIDFEMEHICVDGGSTDATRRIIDRWAERFPATRRVFEPDTGIYDAMNKGLRAARGEYVLFLNSDDFLAAPNALATAMRGLSPWAEDNPDMVVGNVCMGRPGSLGFWRHRKVPRLLGRLPGLFAVHQGEFLQRHLLEKAGGFNQGFRLASDVTLYYDLERKFRPSIRRVNDNLAFMRAGGAANASLSAVGSGSMEIYRHLVPIHGIAGAVAMVVVKTLQSLAELRYGRCPCDRWFAQHTKIATAYVSAQ
jgi:glycosyltransferase involved in cell wall biosynthesis